MTWNSACSIASDDENSRQSFLSDCGSEFDLRPPPRYPAEKRTYSSTKQQSINRTEPPLTRSRAKATGTNPLITETLPKPRRQSALRRSIDAFTELTSSLTNSLNNNNNNNSSILFPKQETTDNERASNTPLDGVNILADRFEGCSIDEGKLNKNCVWPSLETNSHYTRPILFSQSSNPFSTFQTSHSSTTPTFFGQQQAQLWSRFRYAASTLRNDLWYEQMDTTLQQVPTNFFATNFHSNLFNSSPTFTSPQIVPTRLTSFQNSMASSQDVNCSSSVRQRKTPAPTDSPPPLSSSSSINANVIHQQSSLSKLFFTFTIFVIGVILGGLLTNTLPFGLIWQTCVKYFHMFYIYLQAIIEYLRST